MRVALKWTLGVGIALVAIAALAAWIVLTRPIPSRSGEVVLRDLVADVEVRFDARAVPHVRAATEADAYRALGWLHASERIFQMELRRRAAAGRLSEVFGAGAVSFDIESRFSNHVALAQRDLDSLAPEARVLVDAYAQGVNAFLESGARPFELVVMGVHPEPWKALDSLAFARFMLAGLSEAPDRERGAIAKDGGFGAADGLLSFPGDHVAEGGAKGSNAWAIAGSRTRSGLPILANDPHLQLEVPGIWYAAHLSAADGLDVAGLTLAGAPGVVIGHNGRVAWGITMAQLDDADVLLEPVNVAKREVSAPGGWAALRPRAETIRIRGGKQREVVFWSTAAGRILGFSPGPGELRSAVTLEFAPDLAPESLSAFLRAARAQGAAGIESAFDSYGGPAVNLCWASRDGHVGLRIAGAIPVRAAEGVDAHGVRPGWSGRIDSAHMPRVIDPPEGFVASANDDWSVSGSPLPFAGFFASNDRVLRIREVLGASASVTASDSNALQNDVVSNYALRLVARLAGYEPAGEDARTALSILRAWNGSVERKGPARLFHAFAAAAANRLRVAQWGALDRAFDRPVEGWDDPATPAVETRAQVLGEALAESYAGVVKSDGRDPAQWSWDTVHRVRFAHPLSAAIPFEWVRNLLDVGPVGMPGDTHTLDVQAYRLGRQPWIRHMPSARIVVDLGNLDGSTLVLPLGESGHRADAHYQDQLDAWAQGRTFELPFTRAAVDRATVSTMKMRGH